MIRTLTARAILLAGGLLLGHVQCTVIMEATAVMKMSWTSSTGQDLSTEEVYDYSQTMADALMEGVTKDPTVLGPDNEAFQMTVQVREQSQSTTEPVQTLESVVSCLYTSEGMQVVLDTVLMKSVEADELPYAGAVLSFRPYEEASVITSAEKGPTRADVGLIVATCFLSVMLVVVSSVLLYVSGGWDVCQQKLSNCCFEEVEDDYAIDNKSTFQVDDAYDDNENGSMGAGNVASGPGVLGAHLPIDHPGAAHGIRADPRSRMDDETATSMSMNRTLGINSMRNMQPDSPTDKGGLAHMIMSRFTNYTTTN